MTRHSSRLAAALRRGAWCCAQERLPCQFAVVDVEDIMGTSVTNVSKEILKFKIAPDSGHRQEFYIDEQPSVVHEELDAEEAEMHMAMPTELPRLKDDDFERVVKQGDVSLIAFGAPWCPWSQRLEPIWRKTRGCAVQSEASPCTPPARQGRAQPPLPGWGCAAVAPLQWQWRPRHQASALRCEPGSLAARHQERWASSEPTPLS
eukprot:scaffold22574_cov61-Phaeocystis_antarctica.AAC.4